MIKLANVDNLKIIRDSERARELQKKSAKKQRENIIKKKSLKDQLQLLMSLDIKKDKIKKQLKELGIPNTEQNNQMAMNVALFQQALKGNTKAYELIRDTSGEKPVDKVEQVNPPSIVIERPKKKKDE